jgi:translocator protein
MNDVGKPLLRRDLGFAAVALGTVAGALIVGQLATFPNLAPWYAGLAKPSFNPPNWIFGPVWTVLYLLMAFAAWRVLRLPGRTSARRLALTLFFLQLALNVAWSFMFFSPIAHCLACSISYPNGYRLLRLRPSFTRSIGSRLCVFYLLWRGSLLPSSSTSRF